MCKFCESEEYKFFHEFPCFHEEENLKIRLTRTDLYTPLKNLNEKNKQDNKEEVGLCIDSLKEDGIIWNINIKTSHDNYSTFIYFCPRCGRQLTKNLTNIETVTTSENSEVLSFDLEQDY